MSTMDERLAALGLTLPSPAAALANYVPTQRSGTTLYVSGQLPMLDGTLTSTGLVGLEVTPDDAYAAARQCGVNILAQVKAALGGDLGKLTRCVKLTGFVACAPGFGDQPKVVNGASDLMVEVFGDLGRHSRSAVGVAALPLHAPVEIEAIFEVTP